VDRARFELATSSTLVDTQRRRHCQGGDLVPHDLVKEVMTGLIYRPMVHRSCDWLSELERLKELWSDCLVLRCECTLEPLSDRFPAQLHKFSRLFDNRDE
jgi:hypothetical protein